MSGFTEKEIKAELKRRKTGRQSWVEPAAVQCMHCGHPVGPGSAHSEYPLCEACDGD